MWPRPEDTWPSFTSHKATTTVKCPTGKYAGRVNRTQALHTSESEGDSEPPPGGGSDGLVMLEAPGLPPGLLPGLSPGQGCRRRRRPYLKAQVDVDPI